MLSPEILRQSGEEVLVALQTWSVESGVSDIHLSPEKEDVRLEIRLHGVLTELSRLSKRQYEDLLRRVKFLSKLKLNITNVPQDGQYTFAAPRREVNVRVATIPSRFGETITLRLLDPERGIVPLATLGFPEEIEKELRTIIQKPHGLFLVTGPTGSGKTTTLYSLLSTVIGTHRNIITLENPVEYEIAGIVQSEIDANHDYTFASGLRSILRHDPDIILVGEIRDLETAQTAIDASLTGHLVLATLHTNSAIDAIPRLLSMGVSPYTFAPALCAVLAQRLVRTLKPGVKAADVKDPAEAENYGGRMCLPELLPVTDTLREMILTGEPSANMLREARKHGYKTMNEWGDQLVAEGKTHMAEVARVTAPV